MNRELIVVFKSSPVDSDIVRQILNDNGITVNVKNELMGTIASWQVSPGRSAPVEIRVQAKDTEKALTLI